jgi:hypothetical protein
MQIATKNIETLFVNMVLGKRTFKNHKLKKTHFHVFYLGMAYQFETIQETILTY